MSREEKTKNLEKQQKDILGKEDKTKADVQGVVDEDLDEFFKVMGIDGTKIKQEFQKYKLGKKEKKQMSDDIKELDTNTSGQEREERSKKKLTESESKEILSESKETSVKNFQVNQYKKFKEKVNKEIIEESDKREKLKEDEKIMKEQDEWTQVQASFMRDPSAYPSRFKTQVDFLEYKSKDFIIRVPKTIAGLIKSSENATWIKHLSSTENRLAKFLVDEHTTTFIILMKSGEKYLICFPPHSNIEYGFDNNDYTLTERDLWRFLKENRKIKHRLIEYMEEYEPKAMNHLLNVITN